MPIDKTFRDTWDRIGQHDGHSVWQSKNEDTISIHGDIVGVDFSICYGCEKCITACPANVFVRFINDDGQPVVDPHNDSECILCLVCEIVCPVEAISIERTGGSEDTLNSLLHGSM